MQNINRMRINFNLPPAPKISGGPLAVLEYANRLIERGHDVSITTLPRREWETADSPFPWFNFKGKLCYYESARSWNNTLPMRLVHACTNPTSEPLKKKLYSACAAWGIDFITRNYGITGTARLMESASINAEICNPLHQTYLDSINCQYFLNAIPDCDINIATLWSTAIPAYYSRKGKPVILMQHHEAVFYPLTLDAISSRLLVNTVMRLPIYKIANSSWLQTEVARQYGQDIPFHNNAIAIEDFSVAPKLSDNDNIIRILTYSRPEEWKGFGDASAVIQKLRAKFGNGIQWHVFGYLNHDIPPNNSLAPYIYHPKLSFRELASLYAQSDITLCPSWYESFPLPPLESMASGTTVVTTCYGTEDYAVHEQTALVVKPRAIDDMCRAIERLIGDKKLRTRLAAAGRKKAEEFTWDRAVTAMEKNLTDIYTGNIKYDVFALAKLEFTDCSNIKFEEIPADINLPEMQLIHGRNNLIYLIKGNCKRQILSLNLLNHPLLHGREVKTIDPITLFRIPTGMPISTSSDI